MEQEFFRPAAKVEAAAPMRGLQTGAAEIFLTESFLATAQKA
jgi:hypothetical protein